MGQISPCAHSYLSCAPQLLSLALEQCSAAREATATEALTAVKSSLTGKTKKKTSVQQYRLAWPNAYMCLGCVADKKKKILCSSYLGFTPIGLAKILKHTLSNMIRKLSKMVLVLSWMNISPLLHGVKETPTKSNCCDLFQYCAEISCRHSLFHLKHLECHSSRALV